MDLDYLVKNKAELIDLKKSTIKIADSTGGIISRPSIAIKSASWSDRDTEDVIYRTIVGNTYNWMDSHKDVHLNGVFSESIKQRKADRIYHRHDHVAMLTAKVGTFSKVYEQVLNWTDLGINKIGQTMSLLADSAINRKYNDMIFEMYRDGEIDQHSVGMQYVKMFLAVNNAEFKEEYAIWNKYIGILGNPETAIKEGYFWVVSEAKLIEISCVTEGSNELTGVIDPPNGSQKTDPPSSSQRKLTILDHFYKISQR